MNRAAAVKIITKEELREKIDHSEEFKLVDVRDTPDYQKEHIIGAVHLLISEMNQEKLEEMFNKDDLIIAYSLDKDCPHHREAEPPEMGEVVPISVLGGLHHRYERRAA